MVWPAPCSDSSLRNDLVSLCRFKQGFNHTAHPPQQEHSAFCRAAQFHSLIPLTPKPLESLQVYSAEMRSKSGQKLPEFLFTPDPLVWHCCRPWKLQECHSPPELAAFGHPEGRREGKSPEVPLHHLQVENHPELSDPLGPRSCTLPVSAGTRGS